MTVDYSGVLGKAILDYQAKLGAFLQTGSQINSLKAQAAQYANMKNPDVVSTAQAVVDKANGLLDEFNSIEQDGLTTGQAASALQTQMNQDPLWRNLLQANIGGALSNLGTEPLSKARSMFSQVTDMANKLYALDARMDAEIKNTSGLQSDVDNLSAYAQGKGLKPILNSLVSAPSSIIGGLLSPITSNLKYVGLGIGAIAAIYLMAFMPRRRHG